MSKDFLRRLTTQDADFHSNVYFLGFLLFACIGIFFVTIAKKIEPWMYVFMIVGLLIGIAGGVWEYKSFYRKNFNSILNSLKELKDLNEPEDLPE